MKTTKKIFNQEFRDEAVKKALASEKSAKQIAEELGIEAKQLYYWMQKGKASKKEEELNVWEENKRLRKALASSHEEIAILKKAATYFAKNAA